jgi:GxxExxY protein
MEVHSTLGPGFLESTYENALAVELTARGIGFVRQAVVEVGYKGVSVGEQRVDMLVGGRLVLELKATDAIQPVHLAQLRAYLVALNLPLGLVINFNSVHLRSGLKRVVNIR